jgi:NCS1 family nucleobase:cation symporter-1
MTAGVLSQEGMPTHEGDLSIEGHGFEPIPETARYGSVARLFTLWFTPNLAPASFFLGTLAAAGFLKLGFVTALLGIIVGNILGAAVVGILGTMGPKTGMAQLPAARLPFGKSIVLPGLLNWLSAIGWDGVNNVFGALAITILVPAVPFWLALLVIVVLQAGLSVLGYEAIHLFERYCAVALGIVFVILTVSIAGQGTTGLADGFTGADQIGAFVAYVAIIASFLLGWSLYASDYARYLPTNTSSGKIFWYSMLGLILGAGWLEVLGLLVAGKAGPEGSETIFALLGGNGSLVAALAMVAIAVATVAVNALNDYSGSLSLQAAGVHVKRIYSAVVVAILGFLFTLYLNSVPADFAGKLVNFLLFLSYWITPFVAIVMVDWFVVRRQRADVSQLVDFSRLQSGSLALAALIIGFVIGIPFQNSSLGYEWSGTIPIFNWVTANVLRGADLAYYVGGGVAALIYWLGARSMRTAALGSAESAA